MTTNLSNPQTFERRFIKWLKKQPVDKEFDYFNCSGCLFAAFARDSGKFPLSRAGGMYITLITEDQKQLEIEIPDELADAVSSCSHTFTVANVLTELGL